tara:strand:+ start:617 stop:1384 length:768 start_codon:yes stop_codon:yes gene_type:complete
MTKHLVVPDTQVKPGQDLRRFHWLGEYAVDKKPDVIIFIGDHWDMPALSSYDVGKKSFEGRRYVNDITAGNEAMDIFMSYLHAHTDKARVDKKKLWKPRLVFTTGNHEYRIERAIESDPKLDGLISYNDFNLNKHGFEVVPFLQPVVIDGVAYCHYFTSGVMGRAVGNARLLMTKKMMSCVQGHVQDRDIAYGRRGDGVRVTSLFAGIYYEHDEDYLTPQTNGSWSGVWMLNEVCDGSFDELPVSMTYLRKKYGE